MRETGVAVPAVRLPKPSWLTVRAPGGPEYLRLRDLMRSQALHTVCEEARCPNVGECWQAGTATFLILGDICTRACAYCAITSGRPVSLDLGEPRRVAESVRTLGLQHAVVTSVDRDDLPDGGAGIFAATIRWIRRLSPETTVEVLIPDFLGSDASLSTVLAERPEILNHNIETVPRLYRRARPKGSYLRALALLRRAREIDSGVTTKSGLMVGLGESRAELTEVLRDLRRADCDVLTVGQYLRPSEKHLPVERYYPPAEFAEIAAEARSLGFRDVESGPLVRSSYHAERQAAGAARRRADAVDRIEVQPVTGRDASAAATAP